jgi:hypothetical protein
LPDEDAAALIQNSAALVQEQNFDFSSVLHRPPVKKYAIAKAEELESVVSEKVDEAADMRIMKERDPDRYAVLSVDPYSTQKYEELPEAKSKFKKGKKDKKSHKKKVKKDKGSKEISIGDETPKTDELSPKLTSLFANEDVLLTYTWDRMPNSEVLVTFSVDQMKAVTDLKLTSNVSIFFHEDHWTMLAPIKNTPKIQLSFEYTSNVANKHELNLVLPLLIQINPNDENVKKITSTEFLDLVQAGFPFAKTATIQIPSTVSFQQICTILQQLRMRQIDTIDEVAVTLFGYTTNPIVGLVKYQQGQIFVDFKGYDAQILDGLIAHVQSITKL